MASNAEPSNGGNWGRYLGLGLEVAVGVGLGYVVGNWLDQKYGWTPWGTVVGCFIGFSGGMYLLLKDALRSMRD